MAEIAPSIETRTLESGKVVNFLMICRDWKEDYDAQQMREMFKATDHWEVSFIYEPRIGDTIDESCMILTDVFLEYGEDRELWDILDNETDEEEEEDDSDS
jgi:hypothetical protein